jgi:hypothetical protein
LPDTGNILDIYKPVLPLTGFGILKRRIFKKPCKKYMQYKIICIIISLKYANQRKITPHNNEHLYGPLNRKGLRSL